MGLIGGILQPLYMGRPNVLMSPITFLQKPFRWLSALTRFKGTTSGGPNFAYDLCVRKVTREQRKQLDLSRWEVAFNGAEPIREETLERFAETFAPCGFRREAFYPCYGLAEATLIVSGGYACEPPVIRTFEANALAGDDDVRPLVACGQSLPDQGIVIADPETMTRALAGRIGEIWVSGPSVAGGYWRQPEATEQAFRAYLKDTGEGPFLRTGDLGFMQDGELFVTGRLKDLIIVRGMNFYPQDIEQTAQQAHPRLRIDCGAAFTLEVDGRQQFVMVQEVERRKQGNLEAIFQAVIQAVAAEHELALDTVVLVRVGSIPKTSSGKIQRHACAKGFQDGSLAVVGQWHAGELPHFADAERKPARKIVEGLPRPAAAAAPSADGRGMAARKKATEIVLEEIRRVGRERVDGLTLDSPIVETGLDSLERMEILASLEERFDGRFPERILPDLETTRHVVDAVLEYLGSEPRSRIRRPADAVVPPETYHFDQFPEYVELRRNLDLLETSGIGNPFFTPHQGLTTDRTIIDGKEVINFSSYNYQGMSGHPAVAAAAKEAIDRYGPSTSASRLVSGEKDLHGELERALARFLGTEDAVTMVSGHGTNETVIGHLFGPGDLILHDALAHNSIIQGCILSGARRRPFPHNDPQAAERLLAQLRPEYRRVLIAIEGIYSMDGDVSDLPKFIEAKKRHHALLMIDEAHAVGVLGAHGSGSGEHYGVDRGEVDIWMGTLSKGLGSTGGYIAGCKELIEYLKYTAPGFVFAGGISPPAVAAALAAVKIFEAETERFARLRENSELFLTLAKEHGLNTGRSKDSAVIPVILGSSLHCLQLSKAMLARGVNAMPILHPAVEESAARLRFFITTLHSEKQIRYTIDMMVEELEKISPDYLTRTPRTEPAAS
jgi:8-amino-7-oxononanoate synthase